MILFLKTVLGNLLIGICAFRYGRGLVEKILAFFFLCILGQAARADQAERKLYNRQCTYLLCLDVFAILFVPTVSLAERAVGFFCVSLPFLLLAVICPGSFGGGDIKFFAVCGVFLGWRLLLVSVGIAICLGAAGGLFWLLTGRCHRTDRIPFGPFLYRGVMLGMLFGESIITWWSGL